MNECSKKNTLSLPLYLSSTLSNEVTFSTITQMEGRTTSEALRRVESYVLALLQRINQLLPGRGKRVAAGLPMSDRKLTELAEIRNECIILVLLYKNIKEGILSTHRDIYYHLVRKIPRQEVVNRTVLKLAERLRIPREALGVVAGSRGMVGGMLRSAGVPLHVTHNPLVLSNGDNGGGGGGSASCSSGAAIPTREEELSVGCRGVVSPSLLEEPPRFHILSHTRFIVVIEKHAIFFRLMSEKVYQKVPCVLLTSNGFPTFSARRLLHRMAECAPHITVVGLVDYNPSGLAILMQYKFGSNRLDSGAVPSLKWLGLRWNHLSSGAERTGRPFTPRDTSMVQSLSAKVQQLCCDKTETEEWVKELETMKRVQQKFEIEELYRISEDSQYSLSSWLIQCLLRKDFI